MGDPNQVDFVMRNRQRMLAPILEVGSKDYGHTPDFRALFPEYEYIGIDLEAGKGVDRIIDLTKSFESVYQALNYKQFNTIICFSVLEHCHAPFIMAENITKLLSDDGVLLVSVPFCWEIHAYPFDYWRFTPDGVKMLFPKIVFQSIENTISTSLHGEMRSVDSEMFRMFPTRPRFFLGSKANQFLCKVMFHVLKRFRILPPIIFSYPYVFPPVMINMLGIKDGDIQ